VVCLPFLVLLRSGVSVVAVGCQQGASVEKILWFSLWSDE